MASSINASTTAGVVTTADTSGVLNLQTAGTTAIAIDASQAVTFTNSANLPNTFGFKNRIINGAMVIAQRGTSTLTQSTANQFGLDRFDCTGTVSSKVSFVQSSVAPSGFINSTLITSLSAYSVLTGDFFVYRQRIEGLNCSDLGWGAAGAATVTVSFWVRSSLTGSFGGYLGNGSLNRSYPFSYTINAANTWEQKTVTIAGDTTGTWSTTNGSGIEVGFSLGAGSTYSGTANTWAGSLYVQPTSSTSVVGTNGATFYITGVQLEKGSTATSFDYRPYGTELALCQRYCPVFIGGGGSTVTHFLGQAYSATNNIAVINFPVTTRVPATGITATAGNFAVFGSTLTSFTCTSVSFNNADTNTASVIFAIGTSSLTAGNASLIQQNAGANPRMIFTGCEL